ncbi:MAG: HD domain-containing phosphohydrolase [Gammaproteobacteria bacterium]
MNVPDPGAILQRLEQLTTIGIALSGEHDTHQLLEKILLGAQELTNADGGTLYIRTEDDQLRFEILRNDSLQIAMGGSARDPIAFDPIPLYDAAGRPNDRMVVTYAVLNDATINILDAYETAGFDFSGTRTFDKRTGYRSRSFLTVPMKNHENDIIGVLQLINAKHRETGEIVAFSYEDQRLAEALASQAAVALTNRRLIDELNLLFESFTRLIATAIDEKSPYTGGHCRRVPVLTMMLAEEACRAQDEPLKDFSLTDSERRELEIAAWLHDCGKITTPEYIMDKATKLETIFDRIHLIDTRFEVVKREAEIRALRQMLAAQRNDDPAAMAAVERDLRDTLRRLDEERDFLRRCNIGDEFMSVADQERVRDIARKTWRDCEGREAPLLSEDEVYNLTIPRGTLTPEERKVIAQHSVATIAMLESLPFPKHLRNVPEYAGGHHERMDGRGYPNGLTGEQMSIPARIMAIADIFEALTAKDRPYKTGKTLSQALKILGRMSLDGHIDPDLFEVFIREKVYLRYAEQYLDPEQIDEVDFAEIPGLASNAGAGITAGAG